VSEAVALAMASGVRRRLQADVGLGITGVAGPGGENAEKPAGLVWVAVAGPGGRRAVRLSADHGREANRGGAVRTALRLCVEAAERAESGGGGATGG
jgi:PncC family amidohydrolase